MNETSPADLPVSRVKRRAAFCRQRSASADLPASVNVLANVFRIIASQSKVSYTRSRTAGDRALCSAPYRPPTAATMLRAARCAAASGTIVPVAVSWWYSTAKATATPKSRRAKPIFSILASSCGTIAVILEATPSVVPDAFPRLRRWACRRCPAARAMPHRNSQREPEGQTRQGDRAARTMRCHRRHATKCWTGWACCSHRIGPGGARNKEARTGQAKSYVAHTPQRLPYLCASFSLPARNGAAYVGLPVLSRATLSLCRYLRMVGMAASASYIAACSINCA